MKNDKQLVVKSNDLNEAHYRLTTSEQRIILMMVSMIQPDDEDFKTYRIKVSDFLKLLGIQNQQMYPEIKKITKGLMEKVLTIKKPKSELLISWFSSVEYFDGSGYVELCFDPKLKPYLLGLKECFVKYQLQNVIKLKSSYSIRLYELLKQYEKIGKRVFNMEELKNILGITSDEYPLYANFKQKVLSVAQKELKNNTDIVFDFKEIKYGRKVTEIEFVILKNNKGPAVGAKVLPIEPIDHIITPLSDYEQKLLEKLQKYYQLSREQAHEIVAAVLPKAGREYVEGLLAYCRRYFEAKQAEGGQCVLGALVVKAFKEGWQVQKSPFETEAKQKKQKGQEEKKLIEQYLNEFEQVVPLAIDRVKAGFSPEEKEKNVKEFKVHIKSTFPSLAGQLERKGVDSSIFQAMFSDYLAKKYLAPEIYDFEAWVKADKGRTLKKTRDGEYVFVL